MTTMLAHSEVTVPTELLQWRLSAATAPSIASKTWTNTNIAIGDIVDWMQNPKSTKETGAYLLGKISGSRRRKGSIQSRSAIALDADYPTESFFDDLRSALGDAVCLVHDTYSSHDDARRYRVIIPLAEDISPDVYVVEATRLVESIGESHFDASTTQAERGMFLPATRWDGYSYWAFGSALHTVDVAASAPMVDISLDTDFDPTALAGPAGQFNAVYTDLAELVGTFDLPYEQDADGRWSYKPAKSRGGLVEIRPRVWFSHHSSDPAHGHRLTAFDLVRAHKFSELDTDEDLRRDFSSRASYRAMEELALTDSRVVERMFPGTTTSAEPDDSESYSQHELAAHLAKKYWVKRQNGIPSSVPVLDLVFQHDPVLASLEHNLLLGQTVATMRPPWRAEEASGQYLIQDADVAAMSSYLYRSYYVIASQTTLEARLAEISLTRGYSPMRRYLEGLPEWDGEQRLRSCAPGVAPSDYSEMVMRKALCAAISRVYEPGCKWDHLVVLQGTEGLGKSVFLERLFQGMTSSLTRTDSVDALREAHRSWAVIADEGDILTAAGFNSLKEFVTKTHDMYREAYARRAVDAPRSFTIWATTNDEFFLRNRQGNRRFLVLRCENKADFDLLLDDDYINQLWAEAMAYYRMGEPLYLTDDEAKLSADVRDEFTRTDVIEGVVASFADSLVAADWDDMSIEERRQWIVQRDAGLVTGTATRDEICAAQVWVEGLGKPIADARDSDYSRIETALKALEGFSMSDRKIYLPGYGRQRVFIRDSE